MFLSKGHTDKIKTKADNNSKVYVINIPDYLKLDSTTHIDY